MHRRDHVRTSDAQHLVATLERVATEVVGAEVEILDERAERAVEDDDPFLHGLEIRLPAHEWLSLPIDQCGEPADCNLPIATC